MIGPTSPRGGPAEDLWCELADGPLLADAPDVLWCDLVDEATP
ncbi:MAG: hypothetical protein ACT4QF_19450 [Sporichthyaceae bacterium]